MLAHLLDARLCHLELLRRRVDLIVQLLRVDLRLFKLRCLEVERRLQLRRLLRALVGRAATARERQGGEGTEGGEVSSYFRNSKAWRRRGWRRLGVGSVELT